MNMVYQTWVSAQTGTTTTGASDTTVATGQTVKILLPVHQNLHIVEFGFLLIGADPTNAVVTLQSVSGAAAPVTTALTTLTAAAAATQGQLQSKRIDLQVDKAAGSFFISTRTVADPPVTTVGTTTAVASGIAAIQLSLTTGVAATTGNFYIVGCYEGTGLVATTGQLIA